MNFEEFTNLDCCLPLHHPDFRKPTPNEIKYLRSHLDLSQSDVGLYLGKKITSKGCSAVIKWESNLKSTNYRAIELNSWRRLLYLAKIGEPLEDLQDALDYKIK